MKASSEGQIGDPSLVHMFRGPNLMNRAWANNQTHECSFMYSCWLCLSLWTPSTAEVDNAYLTLPAYFESQREKIMYLSTYLSSSIYQVKSVMKKKLVLCSLFFPYWEFIVRVHLQCKQVSPVTVGEGI